MIKKLINQQAIIFDKTVHAEFEEYIVALLQVIPGSKILDVSILPNDRIRIFLDSKETVDELIDSTKYITVSQHIVHIRPYVSRNKRITFHHVFPQVENTFLESELKKCGIDILTPITTLSANFQHAELKHVRSLRRQSTIANEDVERLPTRISTLVEGKQIDIFVKAESTTCQLCQQDLANKCPSESTQLEDNKAVNPQHKSDSFTQTNTFSCSPIVNAKKSPSPSLPSSPIFPTEAEKTTEFSSDKKTTNPYSPSHTQQHQLCLQSTSSHPLIEKPRLFTTSSIDYVDPKITANAIDPQEFNWDRVEQKVARNVKKYPISFEILRTLLTASKDEANDIWKRIEDYSGLATMLYEVYKYLPHSEQLRRRLLEFKYRANQASSKLK